MSITFSAEIFTIPDRDHEYHAHLVASKTHKGVNYYLCRDVISEYSFVLSEEVIGEFKEFASGSPWYAGQAFSRIGTALHGI